MATQIAGIGTPLNKEQQELQRQEHARHEREAERVALHDEAAAESEAAKAGDIIYNKVNRHLSGRDGLDELLIDPNFRADSAKLLSEWCAKTFAKLKS